jgi:hypothetical protein
MKVSEFLMYLALIAVVVLAINQLQKPTDASVVYVPSRWWGGYDNWGWGRRIGYNGRGYGHGWGGRGGHGGHGGRGGFGGGGRGGRGGFGGHH